jgi:hypothetical protein
MMYQQIFIKLLISGHRRVNNKAPTCIELHYNYGRNDISIRIGPRLLFDCSKRVVSELDEYLNYTKDSKRETKFSHCRDYIIEVNESESLQDQAVHILATRMRVCRSTAVTEQNCNAKPQHH